MRNHLTEEELVRLCLARADDPPSANCLSHLQAGCPECQKSVDELRAVLTSLSAPALAEVPESMFRRTLEWLSAQESLAASRSRPEADALEAGDRSSAARAKQVAHRLVDVAAEFLTEIRAILVLDSRSGLALQGVRGGVSAEARQLLYESSAGSIHLLVDPAEDGTCTVRGQFLSVDGTEPPAGSRALIDAGERQTAAALQSTGEFRMDGVSPGAMRVTLILGGACVVLEPIEP